MQSIAQNVGKASQKYVQQVLHACPLSDQNQKIPEEVRNFRATIQDEVTVREIDVDGRTVTPREIPHSRPNNSSVRSVSAENMLQSQQSMTQRCGL